jgi:hypothetical protein
MTVDARYWSIDRADEFGDIVVIGRTKPIPIRAEMPPLGSAVWVLVSLEQKGWFEKVKLRVVGPGHGEVEEPTVRAGLDVGQRLAFKAENIVNFVTVR